MELERTKEITRLQFKIFKVNGDEFRRITEGVENIKTNDAGQPTNEKQQVRGASACSLLLACGQEKNIALGHLALGEEVDVEIKEGKKKFQKSAEGLLAPRELLIFGCGFGREEESKQKTIRAREAAIEQIHQMKLFQDVWELWNNTPSTAISLCVDPQKREIYYTQFYTDVFDY